MIRSCNIAILLPFTYLLHFFIWSLFLPYGDMWCLSWWRITDEWKSCTVGRAGSGPEFRVNFGLGRVGSLHLWVGLDRVKKIGPVSNSAPVSKKAYIGRASDRGVFIRRVYVHLPYDIQPCNYAEIGFRNLPGNQMVTALLRGV